MKLPTGTVTFLFTDIEGSTRLWEQYPEAMGKALARHDALLREAIESHNGVVFKTIGDAFCAAFPTALEALQSALSAQQALVTEPWPQETPIRVRIALHTGTAQERDRDYFGRPVNRVARLLAIGHGEQVLLSQATYEQAHDHLPQGYHLKDLSSHRLKDLQQPEHVFQLVAAGLPSAFPPLRSLQAFANNLPVQLTSFIGREKEIQAVKSLLARTRLLTLTGSGGCGKTRLALQLAADLIEEYSDGVWLVELAALSDPALVPQIVAAALGLREEPGRSLTQTVTDYLQTKTLLLVLDNCEHLVEACAHLVEILQRPCPRVKIVATSREALGVSGEQVYRVPSLLVPDPAGLVKTQSNVVAVVSGYDGPRLFVERAGLHQAGFALTPQNASEVVSICQRLDGIPLAIELAASRVRSLSLGQIAARLQDRFRLLTGGSRTVLPRQQTLRAAIDWSYDLLTQREQVLLARLSVFAGGWSLEASEQVCAGEGIEERDVLDLLTSLVDKSLVVFEAEQEDEAGARYRLLETIREYGWERLTECEEAAEWRRQHRDYFLALAEEAEPKLAGAEQAEWLERLESEHDNLRSALGWCQAEEGGAEAGLRLAGALWRFWEVRGYLGMGRGYLGEALSRVGAAGRTALRARALNGAGNLADNQGDYEVARALYEESLSIRRELGDKQGIANTLNNLGIVSKEQGDYRGARVLYEESLSIRREIGDRVGIAYSLNNLGVVAHEQSDYTASQAYHEQSLAIKSEIGDQGGIAYSLNNLGTVALDQGDYGSSRAYYEQSLAIFREIGDQGSIAYSLNNLGVVAWHQDDSETARGLYEESLSIFRELGDKRGIAGSLNSLGNVARGRGDYRGARTLQEEGLAIRWELGDKWGIAESLEALATLAVAEGRPERAARLRGTAEALREAIHTPLPPNEREQYDRDLAAVREALGEAAFAAAWAEGRRMSMEQVIEYALGKAT